LSSTEFLVNSGAAISVLPHGGNTSSTASTLEREDGKDIRSCGTVTHDYVLVASCSCTVSCWRQFIN
jgi:hypothetical protein